MGKEKKTIADLELNFGIKAIDVYLDAYNEYKRMLREYYVKFGTLERIDNDKINSTFHDIFDGGYLLKDAVYTDHRIGECILYAFYVDLLRKGLNNRLKNTVLNILAANGSKESEVYRLVSEDRPARDKQEKMELHTRRLRRKIHDMC